MRELSKRNRSQAVKFDPSSDHQKKRKVKKLKMLPNMEGNWLDQMHKAHRLKNAKMHKEKKNLNADDIDHILSRRTIQSTKPDHPIARPMIPSSKADHPMARRTIPSPKPEHTLARPLIPSPKPAVFEKVYSTFSRNAGNAGNPRSRRLLSSNSLKRSYALFANSPLMQNNISNLSKTPVTVKIESPNILNAMQNNISNLSKTPVTIKIESPNILNALFANSPLLQNKSPVTVKLESSDSLKCSYSLLTNPSIIQNNISKTSVTVKQESPKTCYEPQHHSSLIISPFEMKKTPKSTTDLLEYLFKSPHILSLIPSRDNPGINRTETDASSTVAPIHSLECLTNTSFPLVLQDPLMPDLI